MADGAGVTNRELAALAKHLLRARAREPRARLYLDAAVDLAGASHAAVAWRRRDSVIALERRPSGGDTRHVYPCDGASYEAFIETSAQRAGPIHEPSLWLPGDLSNARTPELVLPEGGGVGAHRMFVVGADPDRWGAVEDLLSALRPHWLEIRRHRRRAAIDHLTGAYNFRHLRRYLKHRCRVSKRDGSGFSILMLDVDRLREYNAEFGHLMGSRVLGQLGRVLKRTARDGDFVGKYGGDEFLILLREAGKGDAVELALRFKERVRKQSFYGVPSGFITCSIGVATFGEDGTSFQSLVCAADRATYTAKDGGRNRVVAAGRERASDGTRHAA